VRPSDLASNAFAVRNFIGKRASTRALDAAPYWVRARVMAGLPGDVRAPVPLAVLDPAFGALVDACEGRQLPPDPDLVVRSMTLMAASAEPFETERQRNEQILRLLRPILGVDLVKSESDDAEHPTVTDGSSFVLTPSGSRVLLANLELKDRPAAGRPELQNISYYLQHYVPRGGGGGGAPRDALAAMPLLPALLIDIHGGVALSVRGVVVTGFCVLSEVLASAHLVGSPNSPQHWALARLLGGVKAALASLSGRYRAAARERGHSPAPLVPLPIREHVCELLPRRLETDRGVLLVELLGAPVVEGRLVFAGRCVAEGVEAVAATATASGAAVGRLIAAGSGPSVGAGEPAAVSAPCVVKLVARRYGADAHRQAHSASAAPALLGVAALPGGWLVVVMERLGAEDGWRAYDATQPGQSKAVRVAWQRGFADHGNVHGDLRDANILVRATPAAASAFDVRVVDFDWAGRAGEVCYPLTRNADLPWAPGSAPGGPIERAHDEHALGVGSGHVAEPT
jgi:hypothetical protein